MNQSIFHKQLLNRYVNNTATEAELEVIDELVRTGELDDMLMVHMLENWQAEEAVFESEITVSERKIKLWPRIVAVAAAAVAIVFGIWFYTTHPVFNHNADITGKNDIAPGKISATLTLANGRRIRLSNVGNGKLAREAGVTITKSGDGQLVYEIKGSLAEPDKMNTLSTTKGETYKVRLPDGSLVYLNAASSLTYSATLNQHGVRRVKLEGEGYFEISKDKAHPFVVESRGQEVEVLGTHFNVNAYADEPTIATTLLEGSVKVSAENKNQIIKPGEQAVNNGNSIQVSKADIESVIDWKAGDFSMNRVNFKTVMRKIARWYDVEVIYAPLFPEDIESGGWVSRNNKLSVVLKLIESSGQVHFKVEGKKIYVSVKDKSSAL
ncbi:FecR family protein [Pedobacter heparinus]|uniref:FecR protein n=1 Tax=Pedobacter heparinus (strain ATCC 13125 / DSM 2366 / CIP 104194 / JCM 7457 / NBRC 12017 / NCIMB 9290 / NRRL B-14731 / HIM 762-3) TaxID=485917 RepID=C6Y0Z7_PEDHD|nr:FecR family protein [Pedobacter heparinus]ACU04924.1 FecR protein [Pedobacter heparinus DSM 2366]